MTFAAARGRSAAAAGLWLVAVTRQRRHADGPTCKLIVGFRVPKGRHDLSFDALLHRATATATGRLVWALSLTLSIDLSKIVIEVGLGEVIFKLALSKVGLLLKGDGLATKSEDSSHSAGVIESKSHFFVLVLKFNITGKTDRNWDIIRRKTSFYIFSSL